MSQFVVTLISNPSIVRRYPLLDDVIRHVVESKYPYDPNDQDDMQVYYDEEIRNIDELDFNADEIAYELRELKTELATQVYDTLTKGHGYTNETWTITVE